MKKISATEFDRIFDDGKEDVLQYCDLTAVRKVNPKPKRVNVDFPAWMVGALDKESMRLGVTRQSLIKMWLSEKLAGR